MRGSAGRGEPLVRLVYTAIALGIVAVLLSPLYWAVVTSLKSENQMFATPATLLPPTPNLAAYRQVIATDGGAMLTSLIIAVSTAVLAACIAAPAAYALAHFRFRVTGIVIFLLLASQTVPNIVIGTTLYQTFSRIGLLNTYPGLILADSTYCVPFAILVLRAFMSGIPDELLGAARIDGAGEFRCFWSVVLPISRGGLLSVVLFSFLFAWGDFLFALTLTTTSRITPLTMAIYHYIGNYVQDWPAVMAAAVFAAIPAAIILVLAQRAIKTPYGS
jgi:multiple sugar transport system permease protein